MSASLGLFASRALADVERLDSAFDELYRAAWPKVYSFVRCQVRDAQIAQELAGRVFFKAYVNRARAPSGPAAILWIFRIAHNTVIDHWRVEQRREPVRLSLDELADVPSRGLDPEAAYVIKERQALVIRAMGELDAPERSLLALKFAAQRTNREIAAILDLSEAAISMRLLRALRRVRRRLRDLGV